MVTYYYAENVRIYLDLSITLLAISFAIAALVIPYLKIWAARIVAKKLDLEKSQKALVYSSIAKRVQDISSEEGEKTDIQNIVFWNIGVHLAIGFLSWLVLSQGGYYNLIVKETLNQTAVLWAIPENVKVLNLVSTGPIISSILPILMLIGFGMMMWIIVKTYKVIQILMEEEANSPREIKTFSDSLPSPELSSQEIKTTLMQK